MTSQAGVLALSRYPKPPQVSAHYDLRGSLIPPLLNGNVEADIANCTVEKERQWRSSNIDVSEARDVEEKLKKCFPLIPFGRELAA